MNFIVTTTINMPILLKDYVIDFNDFGHDYLAIVVGDLKTPPEVSSFCKKLRNVIYLDIETQKDLFGNYEFYEHIPYNSVERRNFGYLYCFREGIEKNDLMISIDDDNYLKDKDYLGKHNKNQSLIGSKYESESLEWFNPLELFYEKLIYPRGFSIFERHKNNLTPINGIEAKIAVNAGLWENNPDVDALSRIKGLSGNYEVIRQEPIILGQNVWCPFNTQNTAYLNDFWLTAYLCPYVGRFDDIYSSYITKKVADNLGYGISFGPPVVTQERNEHDPFNDFILEIHGMSLTDNFVSFLDGLEIKSSNVLARVS